jgi:hypothetical protein
MFRVDADDVELIGCTVIPNTFLVWRRSENEKYITRPLDYLYATLLRYGPATAARANGNARRGGSDLSELEPDCSSLAALSCSERAVRYAE